MENFFDRLGNIIRSYIDDDTESVFGNSTSRRTPRHDPDYEEAYEDLENFLHGNAKTARRNSGWESKPQENARRSAGQTVQREYKPKQKIPAELAADFKNLGVDFGASLDSCKSAYKVLLKKHHPDRHAGDAAAMKKATQLSSMINASFQRIEYWYTNGKLPG